MKFWKEFKTHLEETLPAWGDMFLCYKPLKKLLKHHFPNPANPDSDLQPNHHNNASNTDYLQEWFIRILNEELDKFKYFFVDKEEEFIIRFQDLKERIQQVKEKSSKGGVFTSESEFSEEIMEIREDLVTIHGEMVLLKNYCSLNFADSFSSPWLIKILKKYDKRTGGLWFPPFTQLALDQPLFSTEPLTRLVDECEENLDELIFPLVAEVIESNPCTKELSSPPPSNAANSSPKAPSTLAEETEDLYRGTIAAMKAIQGLQKASSTSNPMSFSSLYRKQEDESNGTVTAENSATNSSASLHMGEDDDHEDSHSK